MSGAEAKVFWDTNLWVDLFDSSSPVNQSRVHSLLKENHTRIITSTQVLQEFYVAVTRKLEVPLDEVSAEEALQGLVEFCTVSVDPQMILSAARLSREHSFSFWDALIVEAAISGGAGLLMTEDLQDGQVVGTVTIRDPF